MTGATASFSALGTTAAVVVTDAQALPEAEALLKDELDAIDRACSRFRPDSELARANARAGQAFEVSALFAEALRVAFAAAASTGGLVDPTLGAVLRAAGYDRTFSLVQSRGRWVFEPQAPHVDGWSGVELDQERRTVRVPPGLELDLGATAKALAADRAARTIAEATGAGALVSLGGDVAVAGPAPADGWPVLVTDDHAAPLDAPGQVVAIQSGGLATSSTTVRRWPTDKGDTHHIIDPRTGGSAATPWRTVTVAAASCVDANVATTASIVLGEHALAWLEARALPARLVRESGAVVNIGSWPAEAWAA